MKKSIIAAGAASVALAAMPIVSTFAVDPVVAGTVTDTVKASITNGCVLAENLDKTVSISVAPGSTAMSTAAASVTTVCNTGSWYITAVGSGEGANINKLVNTADGTKTISSADDTTSGNSSAWGFKIASISDTTNAAIASGYNAFKTVPATATTVVSISNPTELTVNTQYQVYVTNQQASGTYEGGVIYTVTDTAPTVTP